MPTKAATRKGVSKGTKRRKASHKAAPAKPAAAQTPPPEPKEPEQPSQAPDVALRNLQHERFACEYIKDFNGAQAYARTYPGVTPDTAKANASRLLADANVRSRVEHLAREALAGEKMNAMQVLAGMARIASVDPRRAFDENGALLPIHQLPDDIALAVQSVEVVELDGGPKSVPMLVKKLKFNDRLGALRDLGKHFRLFLESTEKPPATEDEQRAAALEQREQARARLLRLGAPVTLDAA
jgi:phage terminase small subunit